MYSGSLSTLGFNSRVCPLDLVFQPDTTADTTHCSVNINTLCYTLEPFSFFPSTLSSQVLRRGDGGFSASRSLLKFYQNVSGHKKLHMRLSQVSILPASAQAKSIQLQMHLYSRCFFGRITNVQFCQSSIIMCMCICVCVWQSLCLRRCAGWRVLKQNLDPAWMYSEIT